MLRMKKFGVIGAAAAMVLSSGVVLVSAAQAATMSKLPTYEIGYEGPLSNGNAQTGLFEEFGVNLAVQQWNMNAQRHFNIKVVPGDDQGDPNIAPQVATGFVLNPSILAVVGPAFSGATIAGLSIYGANHMVEVSPSATRVSITVHDPSAQPGSQGPFNTYHNFFRVVANDGVQGPADGKYLAKNYGSKGKILVISDGSSYGGGLATQVQNSIPSAERMGSVQTLDGTTGCGAGSGTTDVYSGSLSGVSAVFYGGYYCDFTQVIANLRNAGFNGAIMSGDGSDEPAVIGANTPSAFSAGPVLVTCACSNGQPATWNNAFMKAPGNSAHEAPGPYSAEAYDATRMLLTTMQGLKHLTRASILAAVGKVTYKGITKTISFNKAGDVAGSAIFVNQIKCSGATTSTCSIKQLGLE